MEKLRVEPWAQAMGFNSWKPHLWLGDQPSLLFLWTWLQNSSQLENTSVTRMRTASGLQRIQREDTWQSEKSASLVYISTLLWKLSFAGCWVLLSHHQFLLKPVDQTLSFMNQGNCCCPKYMLDYYRRKSRQSWRWSEFSGLHIVSLLFYPFCLLLGKVSDQIGAFFGAHIRNFLFLSFGRVFLFLFLVHIVCLTRPLLISKVWKATSDLPAIFFQVHSDESWWVPPVVQYNQVETFHLPWAGYSLPWTWWIADLMMFPSKRKKHLHHLHLPKFLSNS